MACAEKCFTQGQGFHARSTAMVSPVMAMTTRCWGRIGAVPVFLDESAAFLTTSGRDGSSKGRRTSPTFRHCIRRRSRH